MADFECPVCGALVAMDEEKISIRDHRIAELEAEVGALSTELLAERARTQRARREALGAAADRAEESAGVLTDLELRRMAQEVKP